MVDRPDHKRSFASSGQWCCERCRRHSCAAASEVPHGCADRSCSTFRSATSLDLLNHLAFRHGPWRCYKIWLMPQAWVSGRDVEGDGARGRRCTRNAGAERKANAIFIVQTAARPGGCAQGRGAALQVWIEGWQSASSSTGCIKGRAGAGRRPCRPPSAGGWMGREHLRCPATCAGGCGKRAAAQGTGATWQWMCSACAGAGRRWGEAGPKAEHVLVWFCVPGQQQNGHVRPECGRGGLGGVLPKAASKWQAGVGKKSASSFYEYRGGSGGCSGACGSTLCG